MESILTSVSEKVGDLNYEFTDDIKMYINGAFMTLNDLGVGPDSGFRIEGTGETWVDFVGSTILLEDVKTYIVLKVRLVFDPPTNAALLEAMRAQVDELEWRLMERSKRLVEEADNDESWR